MIKRKKGFSLIEVLVGMTLISIALVGLAEMFTLSVMNNRRSNEISNATFLAQQQIDYIRTLTEAELYNLPTVTDEQMDLNLDGTVDFRRLTQAQASNGTYKVMVFPAIKAAESQESLLADPVAHKVLAQLSTFISR
jgi:prepilin-type N-terminal cleavage/methylation domain-containing protein